MTGAQNQEKFTLSPQKWQERELIKFTDPTPGEVIRSSLQIPSLLPNLLKKIQLSKFEDQIGFIR